MVIIYNMDGIILILKTLSLGDLLAHGVLQENQVNPLNLLFFSKEIYGLSR
jgi:hypothetical protein